MKAAVLFETNKPLSIEDVSLRKPMHNEVLIRTAASGLCHSDVHFIDGHLPYPMPHDPKRLAADKASVHQ